MNILKIIIENGLSIRQIPEKLDYTWSINNHKEGNEIIEDTINPKNYNYNYKPFKEKYKDDPNYKFYDDVQKIVRLLTKETVFPTYAGYWMCKKVNSTSSTVSWNIKTDNLAPTLEESVKLFLEKL